MLGERQAVLQELNKDCHADLAVPQVHAQLLDQGRYLCSPRTMYRILAVESCVRERRDQLRRPNYSKPQLLATAPNQVWSWDITKLPGPRKWSHFNLYVVIDIFSRYVTGWLIASKESAHLAQRMIREACQRQGILPEDLTIHSDRGATMTSKDLAQLFADLGIVRSLSRPHTSNDNPFSEAQFKTLKCHPSFPDQFGSQEHALAECSALLRCYNHEHHHSALGFLTPADVHYGMAEANLAVRDSVLAKAHQQHPERFPHGKPMASKPPSEVWINPPAQHLATPTQPAALEPQGAH